MRLIKFTTRSDATVRVGCLVSEKLIPIAAGDRCLTELLHAEDVPGLIQRRLEMANVKLDPAEVTIHAPMDEQEVWGAGVTYQRSKVAREEESRQGGTFYDLVYRADRPELFFKATPSRVSGPGRPIRIRADAQWSVPEPELAIILNPRLEIIGYTIGNDVSARDIEGENPLYLPQAKVYAGSCAIGPAITLAAWMPPRESIEIAMEIERDDTVIFRDQTSVSQMARSFEDLIQYLARDNVFPKGAILLTGTGIVPPDHFSLQPGDEVRITITGIGTLSNPVIRHDPAEPRRSDRGGDPRSAEPER
jgi:2-dehydro-3-deoxy-D-arabinonate dehydratase